MDFWERARSFAEEAAKKSHELTQGISSANFSDVVFEASKRSKALAAEASKKSKELADQIAARIPPALTNIVDPAALNGVVEAADLEKYGVTDELREFIKGIDSNTFRDFPLKDDSEMSAIRTVSNVRQDLTEWQERHAKFALSTMKEISKLRYQLCPRVMKERKFWRIYFILVNSHVALYENRYMEDLKLENVKSIEVKEVSPPSKSAVSEQDLDVFLLGDPEDSDDGEDDGDSNSGFDDEF